MSTECAHACKQTLSKHKFPIHGTHTEPWQCWHFNDLCRASLVIRPHGSLLEGIVEQVSLDLLLHMSDPDT
eukprot:623656-Amphidinium_carterae.1